ncbi:MAG: ABC transporter permease [Steroidobacteraceae bacterium]
MFRHYLTSALLTYRRAPFTTGLNVLALALGLACFLFAYALTRYYEMGDRGFANASRIYAVTQRVAMKSGFGIGNVPATSEPVAKYLRLDFPQLENVARATLGAITMEVPVVSGERKGFLHITSVDPEFVDIFDLPFTAGNRQQALREPHSVVLSEAVAEEFFGTRDVVGRRMLLSGSVEATVTGVVGKIPQPSHLSSASLGVVRPDVFASWDIFEALQRLALPIGSNGELPELWTSTAVITYVLLPADGSFTAAQLDAQLPAFATRHIPPEQSKGITIEFGLVPLSGVASQALEGGFLRDSAPLATVLLALGGLVLLIGCLNYANLATAQATGQTKTVGMRRVLGARPRQIATQYLIESALLAGVALVLALGALGLFFGVLKASTGLDLGLSLFAGARFWWLLAGLLLAVTVLAGSYPALILSRVRPMVALSTGRSRAGPRFVPTLLVGVQFAAASLLLTIILVMWAQNKAVRSAALDTASDPIVAIATRLDTAKLNHEMLRTALANDPHVKGVTTINQMPWDVGLNTWLVARSNEEGASQRTLILNTVGPGFFATTGMKLVAGRFLDATHGDDESGIFFRDKGPGRVFNVILDRSASAQLGFDAPQAAIDQVLYTPPLIGPARQLRVIGVVEDQSLHLLGLGTTANMYTQASAARDTPYALIRISGRDVAATLARIDALWNELSPDVPLKRRFVDELFEQSYEMLRNINAVFTGLALFACLIAVMGLIGMAIHVTGKRRHEIGVRKTLGGSTRQVFTMLLTDFSKPVLIANLIAWPLAFVVAQIYLSLFSDRVSLTPVPFVLSLAITLLIAWIAVGGQAWRAARVLPAQILRYE